MQLFISLALKYYEVHASEGGELDEPITKYRLVIWSIKKYFQKLRKIHSQILDHVNSMDQNQVYGAHM